MADLSTQWGFVGERYLCPRCDAAFLAPQGAGAARCPRCFQAELERMETARLEPAAPEATGTGEREAETGGFDAAQTPELAVAFGVTQAQIEAAVQRFASGIPYPPEGLTAAAIRKGLKRSFLPMWLVDAEVTANWKAEAGFYYQVVSHKERYADGGGWATREVTEQRTRWEPRLGRLQRSYNNLPAPALEDHARLKTALGDFDLAAAGRYEPQVVEGAAVRLPDRSPKDAWGEARPALQALAAEECRQAAKADAIRSYAWQPEFTRQNWTLLLLPVYSAAYLDDDAQAQAIWINGQTGRIAGARRASMQRATQASLGVLGVAGLVFVLSLAALAAGVLMPPVVLLGVIGLTLALVIGLGAVVPVFRAWSFNRR